MPYAIVSGPSLWSIVPSQSDMLKGIPPTTNLSDMSLPEIKMFPCTQSVLDCFANDPEVYGWFDNYFDGMWVLDGDIVTLDPDVTRERWEAANPKKVWQNPRLDWNP